MQKLGAFFPLLHLATAGNPAQDVGTLSVLHKDIAIIGGGASGAYSAVRLRGDMRNSVVVIEKQERLGGHVDTFIDPATGIGYEYGVQNFIDIGNARAFFQRLNVSTSSPSRAALRSRAVDFNTGELLANYLSPSDSDRTAALKRYLAVIEQWDNITQPGFWKFPIPDEIPQDLLLPFRDFITKYNLTAGVPQIFATTGFGKHDMMDTLTMWIVQLFGSDMCRALLGIKKSFVPASRKNQDLYDQIQKHLGDDVLLSSTVVSTSRSDSGVHLLVKGPNGEQTSIYAKRLLVAIPPIKENMAPLDLNSEEQSIFNAFRYSRTYVGVISHPSLPANVSLVNMPATAQPTNWAATVPAPPFIARFDNYAPSNFFRVSMVGDEGLDPEAARKLVTQTLEGLIMSGTLAANSSTDKVNWHAFEAHGFVSAVTSAEELKSGFIQRLNSLQGRRSTWYTGAVWSVHLTTNLWEFTDTVLPMMVAESEQGGLGASTLCLSS